MTNHHKSLPLLCRTSGLIVLLLVSAVFPAACDDAAFVGLQ